MSFAFFRLAWNTHICSLEVLKKLQNYWPNTSMAYFVFNILTNQYIIAIILYIRIHTNQIYDIFITLSKYCIRHCYTLFFKLNLDLIEIISIMIPQINSSLLTKQQQNNVFLIIQGTDLTWSYLIKLQLHFLIPFHASVSKRAYSLLIFYSIFIMSSPSEQ